MNDYADRERCYLFVAMTELTLGQTRQPKIAHFSFHSICLKQRYSYLFSRKKTRKIHCVRSKKFR